MRTVFALATTTLLVGGGWFAGCAWSSSSVTVAASEEEIRHRLIGRWLEDQVEVQGSFPQQSVQVYFRSDGSFTWGRFPTDTHLAPEIYDGHWEVHGRKLALQWIPHKPWTAPRGMEDGEIKLLDRQSLEISKFPPAYRSFHRRQKVIKLLPSGEKPNQTTMQLTPGRRTIQFYMTKTLQPAATPALARRS